MAPECSSGHDLMADVSDVENALVDEIVALLYPAGSTADSVIGVPCRVYRGWPSPAALNTDLSAGFVNVTVFPAPVADELPDPYFDTEYAVTMPSTLAAAVQGQTITFTGTAVNGQVVGILADGVPYIHQVQDRETPEGIAATLAVLIRPHRDVALFRAMLTFPGVRSLNVRVVANTSVLRAVRRQRKTLRVSCWCPGPLIRDVVGKSIDGGLSGRVFLNLVDTTKARLHYLSTEIYDQSQSALLYRRDIVYRCEYTTVQRQVAPVMLFGDLFDGNQEIFV